MSLTLHQGGPFVGEDLRFTKHQARHGSLDIERLGFTYAPDTFRHVTSGTKEEMIACGLCKPEWFPQGRKRVSYLRQASGPVLVVRRVKGGLYTFWDNALADGRDLFYEQAFARQEPKRGHLRLVWSARVEGK